MQRTFEISDRVTVNRHHNAKSVAHSGGSEYE
jgi:hypothetical protein